MSTLRLGDRTVEISRPDKVLFPDDGITKQDVVDYYCRIGEWMIPHLRNRPLALYRWPNGIHEHGFFQKAIPKHFPHWIERVTLQRERGGTVTHVVCNDGASLVYLADQAAIELHRLLVVADAPRRPVELILDLDPPPGDTTAVPHAAQLLRVLFDQLDITGFVKSTGSKGIHVHIPLDGSDSFEPVRGFARKLASELARRDPSRLTVQLRKDERGGRLFVDWLRNSYGQHAVAPYSLRALPGAPVAAPLEWEEATSRRFDPRRYRLSNMFRRLRHAGDPWDGIHRVAYSVGNLESRLRS